jgi:hypothetical protein
MLAPKGPVQGTTETACPRQTAGRLFLPKGEGLRLQLVDRMSRRRKASISRSPIASTCWRGARCAHSGAASELRDDKALLDKLLSV